MSTVDPQQLAEYVARQRWFTGTGEDVVVTDIRALGWLREPATGLGVRVALATVADARGSQLYNVPLAYRHDPAASLEHALIGQATFDGVDFLVYDALHDSEAVAALIAGFEQPATSVAGLDYVRTVELELPPDATTVMLSAEQSNTSVIIDDSAMLKFFRRVSPGANPDVEVLRALSPEFSETVPRLYGWLSSSPTEDLEACDLAILQAFLRTATEGWESARTSVRDLLAEPDMEPADAGGDFAGEAERLGAVTRHVHEGMARLLPSGAWGKRRWQRWPTG